MNRVWPTVAIIFAGALSGAGGWYVGKRAPHGSPGDVAKEHISVLDRVPATANIVATMDTEWLIDGVMDANLGLLPVVADAETARAAVTKASERVLGVDVLAAERVIVWASIDPPAVGAMIEGSFGGKVLGEKVGVHRDIDLVRVGELVAAAGSRGILLGTRAVVETLIDVEAGSVESLGKSKAGEAQREAVELVGSGFLMVSASPGAHPLPLPETMRNLRGGALAFTADGGFNIALTGGEKSLEALEAGLAEGKRRIQQSIDHLLSAAKAERNGPRTLVLTIAAEKMPDLIAALSVARDGERVTAEVPGPLGAGLLFGMAEAGMLLSLRGSFVGKSDCERAYDNVVAILKADKTLSREVVESFSSESERKKMLEECSKENFEKVRCFIGAKDMAELGACGNDHAE